MEVSILVARILALIYISAGIGALSGKLDFNKMIEEFERSATLAYLAGFVSLILGMLLVTYHNIWIKDWTVLITLVGWAALIKGVMLMAFPQSISCFKGWYKSIRLWGAVCVAIGLLFGYFGFVS